MDHWWDHPRRMVGMVPIGDGNGEPTRIPAFFRGIEVPVQVVFRRSGFPDGRRVAEYKAMIVSGNPYLFLIFADSSQGHPDR